MKPYKIVFTDDRFRARYEEYELPQLSGLDVETVIYPEGALQTDEQIIAACADADAIFLNLVPNFRKEAVIHSLKKCKVINRYGVGYDNVNVAACTEMGIQVTYVPDYCIYDVSDHALALMMACLRQVPQRDRKIRDGEWSIPSGGIAHRLKGATLGLVGCGRIARCLAKKVSGFEFERILGYDPYLSREELAKDGIEKAELEELLEQSDFISLHMPVTPETRGIIGREAIARMKPNAILINTGRGALIDDTALVEALKAGRIGAAGLDTHTVEPLPAQSPYKGLDNVVLTDHTAFGTVEGEKELRVKSARNVAAVLKGIELEPVYKVNAVCG